MASPAGNSAIVRPTYRICHILARQAARLFFTLEVEGADQVPAGGCLLASNHVSFLDPPLVGCALPFPIFYLARRSLLQRPGLDWLLPQLNVIGIERDKPDMAGLRQVIRRLQEGHPVLIFPEGTRSADGKIQPGQPGTGLIAAKCGVPLVPVRIFGAWEAFPRQRRLPRPYPVRIVYGKPLSLPERLRHARTKEDYEAGVAWIMDQIAALR